MHVPTFTETFFLPPPRLATVSQNPQTEAKERPVLFSDEKYQKTSIQEFMASPAFTKCQQEYVEMLDRIVGFAEQHAEKLVPQMSAQTVDEIRENFQQLKDHLSDLNDDFFSGHKPLVYGAAKEMFHELENLLKDDKISLQLRMTAIQTMAPQLVMCSGGVLTVLQHGISALKHSGAGITGAAHRAKLLMMDALILQHVKQTHRYDPGNEVHFVNAYFNHLAPTMGVTQRLDEFISITKNQISEPQFAKCKEKVLQRFKPSALATVMADDYLNQIKGAAADNNIDLNAPLEGKQLEKVFHLAQHLQRATLDSEFGEVPAEHYLVPVPDTYMHRLAQRPTRMARHFMSELQGKELVDYNDAVRLTKGNPKGDIMQLGDLFWLDKDGEWYDELEAQDLLNVSPQQILQKLREENIAPQERGAILESIAQHVLESNEKIQNGSKEWLSGFVDWFRESTSSDKHWITPVIMLAAAFNEPDTLQALIDARADINAADSHDHTAAQLAARNGGTDALKALIKAGANISAPNPQGRTAAMLAAMNGHDDALKVLINARADVNAKDARGLTAAMLAGMSGHDDALKVLINARADVNAANSDGNTAVMLAAVGDHTDALQVLIGAGANIDAANSGGNTAAMLAAGRGRTKALEALINAEANVHAKNDLGFTAAMRAAFDDHTEALQVLIDAGANIDATDSGGNTAVMLAAGEGRTKALKALINAEANVHAKNDLGFTAATRAAVNGHAEALTVLINAEADINAPGEERMTAVMLAAMNGHIEALKVLIGAKANIDAADSDGYTAAMLAAQGGELETLKTLIGAEANVNAKNAHDVTAVMFTAMNGHTEALQALIGAKANIHIVDSDGYTAAMRAAENGHTEALQVLIDAGANINVAAGGYTAVMFTAMNGHTEALQALIGAAADINATVGGYTAVMFTAMNGYTEALQALIGAGADINAAVDGDTAVMLAERNGHIDAMQALIGAGAIG